MILFNYVNFINFSDYDTLFSQLCPFNFNRSVISLLILLFGSGLCLKSSLWQYIFFLLLFILFNLFLVYKFCLFFIFLLLFSFLLSLFLSPFFLFPFIHDFTLDIALDLFLFNLLSLTLNLSSLLNNLFLLFLSFSNLVL